MVSQILHVFIEEEGEEERERNILRINSTLLIRFSLSIKITSTIVIFGGHPENMVRNDVNDRIFIQLKH